MDLAGPLPNTVLSELHATSKLCMCCGHCHAQIFQTKVKQMMKKNTLTVRNVRPRSNYPTIDHTNFLKWRAKRSKNARSKRSFHFSNCKIVIAFRSHLMYRRWQREIDDWPLRATTKSLSLPYMYTQTLAGSRITIDEQANEKKKLDKFTIKEWKERTNWKFLHKRQINNGKIYRFAYVFYGTSTSHSIALRACWRLSIYFCEKHKNNSAFATRLHHHSSVARLPNACLVIVNVCECALSNKNATDEIYSIFCHSFVWQRETAKTEQRRCPFCCEPVVMWMPRNCLCDYDDDKIISVIIYQHQFHCL